MAPLPHRIYLSLMTIIVLFSVIYFTIIGTSYYSLDLSVRVYHDDHASLKPSGMTGHGLGIAGTSFILFGVAAYMARKRNPLMARLGSLKHWLEFHIFLCTLGPVLILFHTAFKFGGLVSVSFWSMIAVVLSGIVGRFIYLQIPRSIDGAEMSMTQIQEAKREYAEQIVRVIEPDSEDYRMIAEQGANEIRLQTSGFTGSFFGRRREEKAYITKVKAILRKYNLKDPEIKKLIKLAGSDLRLGRKVNNLERMQQIFRYWHVAHLPFAFVMIIIMFIHVGVTILFGYRWIF